MRRHSSASSREARPISRRSRLAVLAGATLFTLALLEVALRIFSPQIAKLRSLVEVTDDERGFAPKPSARIDFGGVFQKLRRPVVWQTNAEGFRDDHDVGAPDERYRIATYGDSETFGWSVALEETFQRQMEAIDPRVEVLNFGVPGYAIIQVRGQLEHTIAQYRPDLAIYLVNKNDFNEPPKLTPWSASHLLMHVHFLWHFTIGKTIRVAIRDEPDHLRMFGDEIDRMTRDLDERDTPFILAFLKWRNRSAVRDYVPRAGSKRFQRAYVDMDPMVDHEPREDIHYTAPTHRKIAALLCQVISGAAEGSCIPPGWKRHGADGLGQLAAAPAGSP